MHEVMAYCSIHARSDDPGMRNRPGLASVHASCSYSLLMRAWIAGRRTASPSTLCVPRPVTMVNPSSNGRHDDDDDSEEERSEWRSSRAVRTAVRATGTVRLCKSRAPGDRRSGKHPRPSPLKKNVRASSRRPAPSHAAITALNVTCVGSRPRSCNSSKSSSALSH